MSKIYQKYKKFIDYNLERLFPKIYVAFVLLYIYVLFISEHYIMIDAPAHLYNAKILNELLFKKNEFLSNFYQINTIFVPNCSGHFIMAVLLEIFSASVTEKIIQLSIVILFSHSYFKFYKLFNPKTYLFLLFFIPLLFNHLYLSGFYNFCIGIIFLFYGLIYYIKYANHTMGFKTGLTLSFFTFCLYSSHLFTLFIFIISIGFYILTHEKKIKTIVEKGLIFIAFILPTLVLLFMYLVATYNPHDNYSFFTSQQILIWIIHIQPISFLFNTGHEWVFSKWYIVLFLIYFCYHFYLFLSNRRIFFKSTNLFLVTILIFLFVICFIFPDGNSTFSVITFRIILFFFLFLLIHFSLVHYPRWFISLATLMVFYINISFFIYNLETTKKMNSLSYNIEGIKSKIKPNSKILTVNKSHEWYLGHVSNYLGVDYPVLISENYEANLQYFPIKFKQIINYESIVEHIKKDDSINEIYWSKLNSFDYIFVLQTKNTKSLSQLNYTIGNRFKLVNYSKNLDMLLYHKQY